MSSLDEYPVHDDCEKVELPPRSTFYRLEPRGLGTAERESLSSYVMRLAHEHCVSPQRVVETMRLCRSVRRDFDDEAWAYGYISGVGSAARSWSEVLAEMTGHTTLEPLTLLSLVAVVSKTGLMSERRKWCPECLRCEQSEGIPHGHLLWDISIVDACPKHRLRLADTCAWCGMARAKWRRKRLPHLCAVCGGPLWKCSPRHRANEDQIRIAKLVAEFLDDSRLDRGAWKSVANGPATFLKAAARLHFEGKPSRLARMLGISKGGMHGWCSGAHRPRFSRLVLLADRLGCSVADVLSGRADATRPPTRKLPRAQSKRPNLDSQRLKELAARLESLSKQAPPLSLAAIARELGAQTKALRAKHPALSARIIKRYAAERLRRRRERETAIVEGIAALVDGGRISDVREYQRLRRLNGYAQGRKIVALGRRLAGSKRPKVSRSRPEH